MRIRFSRRRIRAKKHTIWQENGLIVFLLGVFLVATTIPRFGTLWHTHAGGHTAHHHATFFAQSDVWRQMSSPPHHHDHRRHSHALPFGGHYAHATSHADHPTSGNDSSSPPHYEAQTDRHWHFYDASLPPHTGVIVPLWLSPSRLSDVTFSDSSLWSQLPFLIRSRAPPPRYMRGSSA